MKSKQLLNTLFLILLCMSLVTGSRSRMKIHAKKVLKPDSTVEKEGKTNSVGYTAKQIDETMAELNKV